LNVFNVLTWDYNVFLQFSLNSYGLGIIKNKHERFSSRRLRVTKILMITIIP